MADMAVVVDMTLGEVDYCPAVVDMAVAVDMALGEGIAGFLNMVVEQPSFIVVVLIYFSLCYLTMK